MQLNTAFVLILTILAIILVVKKLFQWRGSTHLIYVLFLLGLIYLVILANMKLFYRGIIFRETFINWAYIEAFKDGAWGASHWMFLFVVGGIAMVCTIGWKSLTSLLGQSGVLNFRAGRAAFFAIFLAGLFVIWNPFAMNMKAMQVDLQQPAEQIISQTASFTTNTGMGFAEKITDEFSRALQQKSFTIPPKVQKDLAKWKADREKKKQKAAEKSKRKETPKTE